MRWVLETDRLHLREMDAGDLDFIAEMLSHPDVMRHYPKCYSRDESRAWIDRSIDRYAKHGCALWLVVDKTTRQSAGQVGLVMQHIDGVDEPEIGYLLHRPFWNRGYAIEAARGVRDYAFAVRQETRVISLIRPENIASAAVARKLGMTVEKRAIHAGIEHQVFALARPV